MHASELSASVCCVSLAAFWMSLLYNPEMGADYDLHRLTMLLITFFCTPTMSGTFLTQTSPGGGASALKAC